ncbi:MAG: glycosyltransferase family 1 protein [Isosphaeraceae bacterium]
MRIGFDGSCLANRRGFGRFARQALQALAASGSPHQYVVIVDRPSLGSVTVPEGCEVVPVEVAEAPSVAASSTGRRRLGDMLAMGRASARSGLDLMYFPASYSFFPVWNVGRVVVTMHDTLAMANPSLVFPNWKGRAAWTLKEHAASLWADAVVTVSESARRDLIAWFRLPESRVRVVSEGPEAVFGPRPHGETSDGVLARYGIDPRGRFLLYVGGLSPHKNLPRLIEGFATSDLARDGVTLAIVGDKGDVFHTHFPELEAVAERQGVSGSVVFTGFVPDEDLVYLYNRCEALVQPSLAEGFGLPPVEAMACGAAIVASTAGSLPEVVGDAGLLFDPTDVAGLADCLRRVVLDPGLRLVLRAKARERATLYSWEETAEGLLDVFESLAPRRERRHDDRAEGPGRWRRSA